MKLGRNDLCPCGSGKKYKKCCLKKQDSKAVPSFISFPKNVPSDYDYIASNAIKLSQILSKYSVEHVVCAIFCFNSWRRNRSALAQSLTLNSALSRVSSFGRKPIENYQQLTQFL